MSGCGQSLLGMPKGHGLWFAESLHGHYILQQPLGHSICKHCWAFSSRSLVRVLVEFVDCFLRYTTLVLVTDHTASTVSNTLVQHVVSYFGVPCHILSDRGHEFTRALWQNLLRTLGSQRLLTFPCHPEGNAINERSHRTLMSAMRVLQQNGQEPKGWTCLLLQIMLTLNLTPHAPHHHSSSLIATG